MQRRKITCQLTSKGVVSPEFRVGMKVEVMIEMFVLCLYWKGVAREEENALEIKIWRSELEQN